MAGLVARIRGLVSTGEDSRFAVLVGLAILVGLFGGLVATGFAWVLYFLMDGVWGHLQPSLSGMTGDGWVATILITTVGGLIVGVCLKVMGAPGEIAAVVDNIHMKGGRLDPKQSPSMTVAALASITAGGSAGPEAPLVQIIGSMGSWLADFLRLKESEVRTLTFCGMAAALGAFFGAPLGGALFALEIPHRNGIEYFEAMIPAVVSAFVAFFVFGWLSGVHHPLYALPELSAEAFLPGVGMAIGLGVLGVLVALVFQLIFKLTGKLFSKIGSRYLLAGALGGLSIGLLAMVSPLNTEAPVMFWGEFQLQHMLSVYQGGIGMEAGVLVACLCGVALFKILSIGCTLHSGFRGGFIFPLFFVGAALGLALHAGTGGWIALPVAVLGMMAAVNVAVTKTPLSTAVILTTLSGTSMLPVVLAASLTSFLVSSRVRVIATQRSRATTMRLDGDEGY